MYPKVFEDFHKFLVSYDSVSAMPTTAFFYGLQVGEEILYPHVGAEIWIPANTKHRLASRGPEVRVLEVAFGNWQQADITRYEDDFQRPDQGE